MNLKLLANIQIVVGIGSTIIGFLLVVAPGSSLFSAYESSIALAILGSSHLSEGEGLLVHWLLATCGAGVVGWGIAWVFISHVPLRRGERWAWWCLLSSLCVWVIVDMSVAIWFGVYGEVIFVAMASFAAMLPLVLSASLFKQ